jgi:peroxiredoxin
MSRLALLPVVLLLAACGGPPASSMAIGAPAPDFSLPGVDGRVHTLAEYAESPVVAIVFMANGCPASQQYEARIQALAETYRDRRVAVMAVNPNNPDALRLDALGHTDVGESLEGMKTRAAFSGLTYPYLSDGDTQALTRAMGVTATPQMFIFDRARSLRYQGRIDDNVREALATTHEARDAIDALLAGRPVAVAETTPIGCAPALATTPSARTTEAAGYAAEPVTVQAAGPDELRALRRNGTGKLLLVNYWATWCGPCVTEFPDLEATYRMYRARGFDFVAVSTNEPQERPAVIEFLRKQHASHRNLQFGTPDVYALQEAFDPKMPAPVPFTLLLAPNGDVLYQELGASDIPRLRRAILSHLPDDRESVGQQAYWSRDSATVIPQ